MASGVAYVYFRSPSTTDRDVTTQETFFSEFVEQLSPQGGGEEQAEVIVPNDREESEVGMEVNPSPTPQSTPSSVTTTPAYSSIINANLLQGGSWASPLLLGSSTPNSAVFANVTMNGAMSANGPVTLQQFENGFLRVNGVGEVSASRISLSSSSDVADRVPTASGGTGNDFSSATAGSVLSFSSTGQMSLLAPGTSGYVLTSNGPGGMPSWESAGSATVDWASPGALGSSTPNTGVFTQLAAGTGLPVQVNSNGKMTITYVGDSGFLSSSGGALFLNNTSNVGTGIGIYSNAGADALGNMINVKVDNPLYDQAAFYMNYDGQSNAVEIVSNSTDSSSNALAVTGNNINDSTVGIIGYELGRGTIKVTHNRPGAGNDQNASGLSIDLKGVGTRAQGVYVDSTEVGGTLGNLLRLRNESIDRFVVGPQGNTTIAGNITQGVAGTDTTFTKNGNNSADQFFVGTTGAFRVQRSAGNSEAFRVQVNGDTQGRWLGTSDGQLKWGPGNATQDVTLRRGLAGTLFVDGALFINNLNQDLDTVIKGVTDSNLLHLDSSTDRIGIGLSSPTDKLHVSGSLRVTGAFKDSSNSAGSSGYLLASTGTGTGWLDPSSLSIGNASTLNGLDSSQFLRSDVSDSFTSGTLTLDSGTALVVSGDLSVADTNIALTGASTNLDSTGNFSINTNNFVVLKSSGNVGIGATNPEARLHVTGIFGGNALAILNQTGNGDIFTASASGTTRFTIANNGNVSVLGNIVQGVNGSNTSFTKVGNTAGDEFFVGTNGAFRVSRSASGSEAFRVQVSGDTQGRWVGTSDGRLSWGPGNAAQDVTLRRGANGVLWLDGGLVMNNSNQALDTVIKGSIESNLLYINGSTDRIGIGTSSPVAGLHITRNTATLPNFLVNQTGSGDILTASSSGTTRFTIANSGAVLMNGALTVGGTTTFNAQTYTWPNSAGGSGYVLSTNGSGTLSWIDPSSLSTNYWQLNSGVLSQATLTNRVGLGVTSLTNDKTLLQVQQNSANNALVVLNETGGGDIIAASASGTTRFRIDSSGNVIVGGNVGVGVNAPNKSLLVGSGSNPILSADVSSNRLGIGIANPNSIFHVRSSNPVLTLENTQGTAADRETSIQLKDGSNGNAQITFGRLSGGTDSGGYLSFYTQQTNGTLNEKMRILANGNVGIGNVLPLSRLDITSSGTNTDVLRWIASDGSRLGRFTETSGGHGWFEVDNSSGNAVVVLRGDGGSNYLNAGLLGIGTTTPAGKLDIQGGNGGNASLIVNQTLNGDIFTASSSGTTRMVINQAGLVGIGTTNPIAALHISKDNPNTPAFIVNQDNNSQYIMTASSSGVPRMVMTNAGHIGIGTQTPGYQLDVLETGNTLGGIRAVNTNNGNLAVSTVGFGADNHAAGFVAFSSGYNGGGSLGHFAGRAALLTDLGNPGNGLDFVSSRNTGDMRFYTGGFATGNERMRISSSGLVGIGRTPTNYRLEVNGAMATTSEGDIFAQYDGDSGVFYPVFARYWDADGTYPSSTFIFGNGTNAVVGIEKPGGDDVSEFRVRAANTNILGDLTVTGSCTGCSSDERLKKNTLQLNGSALEKLLSIKGVSYEWSDAQKAKDFPGLQIGVIAQDVEKVFPELVGTDNRGFKFVRYDKLIAPTIEAIREQQTQISTLDNKVGSLSAATVESLSSLFSWTNNRWQVIAELTFAKAVEFKDRVTFATATVFKGKAEFEKPIAQSKDAAGAVILPSGAVTVEVKFAKAYEHAPFVNVTPVGKGVSGYYIDAVSKEGFTLKVEQALSQDVQFNWSAVMTTEGAVLGVSAASPVPTVSPVASPQSSASPAPVVSSPEPSVSPSPTVIPSPSSSPLPSTAPSPSLEPTPSPTPTSQI